MKLTETKLRKIVREELQKLNERRPISASRLDDALSGLRISNVNAHGKNVTIVASDGRTSKALTIEGDPDFKIERI